VSNWATRRGEVLIRDCGAQTEATTADGKTPFDIAWQERKNDVVVYLSDLPTKNPPSTGRSSSIADSSTDFTIKQSLATSENSNDDRARFDEEIANGRMELERMLNNPTAEPTCWSIRYLDDCTDNFNSKVLGEGAFGKVYFGCDKVLGFQFAVKRVPLSVPDEDALNEIIRSFKREISVRIFSLLCKIFFTILIINSDTGTQAVSSPQYCGFVWI
jgi:hypothetical protein